MDDLNNIQRLVVWALPVLFAITVHEVAHGWVAKQLGDKTAMMLGRLTLNPIKHIDPMGTILVPGLLLLFGGFIFGWAKPVPVTWENLRHPKRDMALVAAAGPIANLFMALLWGVVMKIGITLSGGELQYIGRPLAYMGFAGIQINVLLMVFNLIPLPPLDGGRVMVGLLPGPASYALSRVEPFGFFIILGLLISGVMGYVLGPPIDHVLKMIFAALKL